MSGDPLPIGPEVRIDQLTGLRTILAPARADRPLDFSPAAQGDPAAAERCPFCEGREDRTPAEVWADRPGGGAPDSPGWRTRAVPNLYPALDGQIEPGTAASGAPGPAPRDPLRASARGGDLELFASAPAAGVHEVIVHGPTHRVSLAQFDVEELAAVIAAWRERIGAHSDRASYVQLIVNEGAEAGASLEHSHAQLYALGLVPVAVARERERCTAHHQRTMGGELLADVISAEVRRGDRLVAIDDDAVLVCPWASRSPFELRLAPRRQQPRFELDEGVGAQMLHTALRALVSRFGSIPALNLWVRTAPRGAEPFGWHIDIAPRVSNRAGFELATAVEINIYPPERAAAELREALGA